MRVAIIPARGGSKRIPRKNIRMFCGKPIIAWSIEAALKSQCFDDVIVSTDDEEIAEVAEMYGANLPFRRPTHLSDDYTSTNPVVRHAIKWLNSKSNVVEQACCLYATAPFVSADDIAKGMSLLSETGCDYAFTVTSYPFPIQRAIRITAKNRIEMLHPEYFRYRSQDLEQAFHDAGQFYWGKAGAWLTEKPILLSDAAPLILPRHRVQDIDTLEDWHRAEWLFREMLADSL